MLVGRIGERGAAAVCESNRADVVGIKADRRVRRTRSGAQIGCARLSGEDLIQSGPGQADVRANPGNRRRDLSSSGRCSVNRTDYVLIMAAAGIGCVDVEDREGNIAHPGRVKRRKVERECGGLRIAREIER